MARRRLTVCAEPGCGRLTYASRCPEHPSEYETTRPTSAARGYNRYHRALRAQWQARIDAGELVYCADGCGARITGTAWDLGHDHERGGYIGPQTQTCNRSDGGRRGAQVRNE